jgi:hypothetical protein
MFQWDNRSPAPTYDIERLRLRDCKIDEISEDVYGVVVVIGNNDRW